MRKGCVPFKGVVYRAHNPHWSFAPDSGTGAARFGGRFNPPGLPALYTSLSFKTAWNEAQQGFPLKPQPLTLVAYEVDYDAVLDLSDRFVREATGIHDDVLACSWELLASQGETPPSWSLARRLIEEGVTAIVVPGFAPGADEEDRNAIFWQWAYQPPKQVRVIDDFGRLSRPHG